MIRIRQQDGIKARCTSQRLKPYGRDLRLDLRKRGEAGTS